MVFVLLFYYIFWLFFLVITYLSGVKVYGKEIKVTVLKYNFVLMFKEGDVSIIRVFDLFFIVDYKLFM